MDRGDVENPRRYGDAWEPSHSLAAARATRAGVRPSVNVLRAADPAERRRWEDLVAAAPGADIYHRPGYGLAYEAAGHGRAIALEIRGGDAAFLVPLILRSLEDLPFRTQVQGWDAVSPYGFGGPLPLVGPEPTELQVDALCEGLRSWCGEARVISVLLRLHPMLDQVRWFAPVLEHAPGLALRRFGPTQAIPVEGWDEQQMDRNRRYNLRRARRELRTTLSVADDPRSALPFPEALRTFDGIYQETMARLGASPFYRFPRGYLETLERELPGRVAVAIAWLGALPVAADLFLRGEGLAHCHLSGTMPEGRVRGAATVLVLEGVAWARATGCRALHLGGGTSGDDDLLRFKRSFGGRTYEYAFATLVADPETYAALTVERRAQPAPLRPDFFPEYRA